ncbi:TRIM2_3 [Mytilus edulis]|uniref:TRIM2_3 n=1 Tax=Mytilus edulis TaxID=6550 RepID=A0A8S3SA62_MYTED|nr:TRIM2_3 [Mytilus edulis]
MATANLEECEKICVELLNCTQCETRYDQSSHQPRILPCLHTICTDCLMKSFESNSIECTVCQKSVNIQDSFESLKDDFPIDFTIRDRIEFDGHENRPLEIFCTGNGCKRPVCNMCFAIDHSDSGDHQAKDVQDVFKLEMERIFDKYKETEELRHGISEVRKRIKDEISAIKRQKETEQHKLNEFFIHCHELLKSRQNVLTQKLGTEIEIKMKALTLQEEELDSFQNKILTSKVFLQQASLSKNAPAFLA